MGIKGSFTFISFPWQSKSVRHKRYSDYNPAAMMLDRTRGEKKKKRKVNLKPRFSQVYAFTAVVTAVTARVKALFCSINLKLISSYLPRYRNAQKHDLKELREVMK